MASVANAASPSRRTILKWVSLLLLVAQTVGVVSTMRYVRTRQGSGPKFLNTTAVVFSEITKLFCSFIFLWIEQQSFWKAWATVYHSITSDPRELMKISVPSLLYTLQNNLLFVGMSNLSGPMYQVTYQLKILSTAVLSVLILGKSLDVTKWVSLLVLSIGVTLIQLRGGGGASAQHDGNAVIGLVAVLAACLTSGMAGVYLEKVLKGGGLWTRNVQMALFSIPLALVGVWMENKEQVIADGFLQGYSYLVWCVILLQAAGGLVVAAVLKYSDNIQKCFGNAMATVLNCVLSSLLLREFAPNFIFGVGVSLVLLATTMYSLGAPKGMLKTVWRLPKSL